MFYTDVLSGSDACWEFMYPVTVPDERQALKCPFKPACDITAERLNGVNNASLISAAAVDLRAGHVILRGARVSCRDK